MTKTSIVKWLENKRRLTLATVEEKYGAIRKQKVDNLCTELGLKETADQIHTHFDEITRIWNEWKKKHQDQPEVSYTGNWCSLDNTLQNYTNIEDTYDVILGHTVSLSNNELRMDTKSYQELRLNIIETYDNVIAAVKSMKSVKDAAAYLKELGFDLADLEAGEKPQVALAVQVNTQFLFLKKSA